MNRTRKYGLCLLALAGLPASAYAQVGTPPPATEDAQAEPYTPPTPPKSFTAEGRANLKAEAENRKNLDAQRAQTAAQAQLARQPEPPKFKGIPNVQVPVRLLKQKQNSLVRGDGKGHLKDWWGPLDLHALRLSPLIGDLKTDEITAVVYDRNNRVEQRMIANLDIYREIEEKKNSFESKSGIQGLSQITQIIKPIVEPGSLSIDLYHAKALSAMQGKFNEEMVREYKRELTQSLRAEGGSNPLAGFAHFMLEDAMREPRFAHDLMVAEILMNYDAIMEAAGLSDMAEILQLGELSQRVPGDSPTRVLVNRATPLVMSLSLEDHTSLLMAVRELRENPDVQPLLKIELLKKDQTTMFIDGPEGAKGGVKVGMDAIDPDGDGKTTVPGGQRLLDQLNNTDDGSESNTEDKDTGKKTEPTKSTTTTTTTTKKKSGVKGGDADDGDNGGI